MASVAELIARKGQLEAQSLRDRGEVSARTYANLSNILGQSLQAYSQYNADAPKRMEQARTEKLRGLFQSDQPPTSAQIISIVGPERGAQIVAAVQALGDHDMKQFKDRHEVAAAVLAGMDNLPEDLRAQVYPGVRQSLLQRGVIGDDDAPKEYSKDAWAVMRGYGQSATKAPEPFTLTPGQQRFGPDGRPIAAVPAPFTLTPGQQRFGPDGHPIASVPAQNTINAGLTPALVDGKPALVRTGSNGHIYDTNNQMITGKVTPIPPKTTADQAAQAKMAPALAGSAASAMPTSSQSGDMQDVLEGRNTLFNIRQTMGRNTHAEEYMRGLRDLIRKQDPQFDFVASDAGGKSVSSSYVQRSMAALNSVLPNVDAIIELSNQVQRVGMAAVDKMLQSGAVQFGNKKVANFRQAQKLLSDEVGAALGAGSASDMKLQLGFDVTDGSARPDVFASNMEILRDFIKNRKAGLDALRYRSSTTPPVAALTPQSQQILEKLRGGGSSASGQITVVDPTGKAHLFDTQAQADAFKKSAGIK